MSTRSGKRIHKSFHENIILKPEMGPVVNSERKTRSRRLKENIEDVPASAVASKKRTNYVSYPVGSSNEEENGSDTVDSKEEECKNSRTLRKTSALKERNYVTPIDTTEPRVDVRKSVRTTRRTRKFPEDAPEDTQEPLAEQEHIIQSKPKKGRKKKIFPDSEEEITSKKKSKKKRGRGSGPLIVEHIEPEKNILNKSNVSNDSFHSAAGSPLNENKHSMKSVKCLDDEQTGGIMRRRTRSISKTNGNLNTTNSSVKVSRKRKTSTKEIDENMKDSEIEEEPKKRKSLNMTQDSEVKNATYELENEVKSVNTTFDKPNVNTTYEKDVSKLDTENSVKDLTFDKQEGIVELQGGSGKKILRKSIINTTYDKSTNNSLVDTNKSIINTTYEKDREDSVQEIEIKNDTFDKIDAPSEIPSEDINEGKSRQSLRKISNLDMNNTFDKKSNSTFDKKSNSTFDKTTDTTFEKSVKLNSTFDNEKSDHMLNKTKKLDSTFDKEKSTSIDHKKSDSTFEKTAKLDSTFEKETSNSALDKSDKVITLENDEKLNSTFDKNSKSSLVSSDNSNILDKSNITLDKSDVSRISITSDESKENIVNMTPLLIESSFDESANRTNVYETSQLSQITEGMTKSTPVACTKSPIELSKASPITPLQHEGTFTRDSTSESNKNLKKQTSLPSPGCTPFPNKSSTRDRPAMNITRSIEKSRRSSLIEPLPRMTKVMFCSPVNNPVVVMQQRKKVIKSNLKGSNKSFVFDDNASSSVRAAPRKRSYTHNDADEATAKRSKLADSAHSSGDRAARSRTCSATGKLAGPTTSSKKTPSKAPVRTKLPNFAALHQREFAKMESLDECQERKAKRARQLLTPTGSVAVLERTSPSDNTPAQPKPDTKEIRPKEKNQKLAKEQAKSKGSKEPKRSEEPKKPETPVKSLPTFKSLNPGYTRFGFKLNLDANPFSVPSKISRSEGSLFAKKDLFQFSSKKDAMVKLKRQVTAPSLAGTTSLRREAAKQIVMREKSFTDKRREKREETRTVIKGVRTNRRFELQMRMRNLD